MSESKENGIVELLKQRMQLEEDLLNKISRFLMLLENSQPGAIRKYRNVCINPVHPDRVVIVFQDLDGTFNQEFPAELINNLNLDKLNSWLKFMESETEGEIEQKSVEIERKVFNKLKQRLDS